MNESINQSILPVFLTWLATDSYFKDNGLTLAMKQ